MASMKDALLAQLASIDSFEARPSQVAGGTALFHRGKEFAHFHNDHEIDLRLTRKVIKSLGLAHPARSGFHPTRSASSQWIELRFHSEDDVRRVAALVRRAVAELKA
ncbi:MAG: DUF5519 family protein [Burkholderiales bacterium]